MIFICSLREHIFPLFFLSSSIYSLFGLQIIEARCLIISKSSGLCQECASDYYYPDLFNSSSKNSPPVFPSALCVKKRSLTETFNRTVYVANQPCAWPQATNDCHYMDLGQALVQEAQATQSYQNGTLKFLLIGSVHHISSQFLPFAGIELFKRSGYISITVETLSREKCLFKGFSDCPPCSKILFRSQNFSLFVSGELIIRNVIIDV